MTRAIYFTKQEANTNVVFLQIVLGRHVTRADLGLPKDWSKVEGWCRKPFRSGPPLDQKERKPTEFDHVNFTKPAEKSFGRSFRQGACRTQQ